MNIKEKIKALLKEEYPFLRDEIIGKYRLERMKDKKKMDFVITRDMLIENLVHTAETLYYITKNFKVKSSEDYE